MIFKIIVFPSPNQTKFHRKGKNYVNLDLCIFKPVPKYLAVRFADCLATAAASLSDFHGEKSEKEKSIHLR